MIFISSKDLRKPCILLQWLTKEYTLLPTVMLQTLVASVSWAVIGKNASQENFMPQVDTEPLGRRRVFLRAFVTD